MWEGDGRLVADSEAEELEDLVRGPPIPPSSRANAEPKKPSRLARARSWWAMMTLSLTVMPLKIVAP